MNTNQLTRAQQATRDRLARERVQGREALDAVKDAIREPYAWPGGYRKVVLMADGELLCTECARREFRQIADATLHHTRDGWEASGAGINWESPDEACCHCGADLVPEYFER